MAKFALMLPHAPDRYTGLSEDDYMGIIKDYIAWVEAAVEKGVYLGGEKLLESPGRVVSRNGSGLEVHESPFTELTEILGGFMIVEAEDYDAAVALCADHPHLVHNQHIEIRQLQDVD
ncbi:MAG: YciI family protein [Xanthomonadales bacterium]|nr:YciI family protein [Xanthomonadales bacterium]